MVTAAFQLNLPKPRFPPIRIGQSSTQSRLDQILQACRIDYQKYILYVEAFQKSNQERIANPQVFLVLTQDGLIAVPRDADSILVGQQPWSCVFTQIESVHPVPSQIPGHFGINLNFYNKDADAAKISIITFDCKEQVQEDDTGEEQKAGRQNRQNFQVNKANAGNLSHQFMQDQMKKQSGMKPMEFSVLYLIQRQLPIYWQKFFEEHLRLLNGDCYQCHAFVVKRNTFFINQRRFIVMSNHFMINVEADFNKNCTMAEFKDLKWKVPLAALKALQIESSGSYNKLTVFFDLIELNKIMMEKYGAKKPQKKDKRALKFVDLATLRDFVFHLRRLFHVLRRSKAAIEVGQQRPDITITCKSK